MSTMLEQAFIDANALRDAALKSAETEVINKYSFEIKEAVSKILEEAPEDELDIEDPMELEDPEMEEEPAEAGTIDAPLASTEGETLCACPDDEQEVTVDVDELLAMANELEPTETAPEAAALQEDVELDEEIELDEDSLREYISGIVEDCPGEEEEIKFIAPEPGEMDPLSPEEKLGLRRSTPRRGTRRVSVKSHAPYSSSSPRALEETELEEGIMDYVPGTAAHNIASEIGNLKREEAEAIKAELEAYLGDPSRSPTGAAAERSGLRGTARAPEEVAIAGITAESIDEEIDIDEELLEKVNLDVKTSGQKGGWQAAADNLVEYEAELEAAKLESTELEEEKAELEEANKDLTKENKEFRSVILQMKEKLDEVNLSNAKLLYTNRVLDSNSLNERQRKRIVESINKADSPNEAKVIFDTLQSAVGTAATSRPAPKSLSEAVSRPSSILSVRKEEKVNPYADRMKILAGIKNSN